MTSIATEILSVDGIETGDRLRPVDVDGVARLADSMAKLGLQTPITVRAIAIPQGDGTNDYRMVLIAGLHRLEAAKRLGWTEIQAIVREDGDELQDRLWEISENLARADLTVQQRSDQIVEWIRLSERVAAQRTEEEARKAAEAEASKKGKKGRGVSSQVETKPKDGEEGDKLRQLAAVSHKGGRGKEGGTRATARDLGLEDREVRRAVKIASITPEARVAADEAGLTSQKARLEIASAPAEEQVQRVAEVVAAARSKPVPLPKNELETEDDWRNAMMRLWNRAPDEWRERFIDYVQAPVFGNTPAAGE